MSIGRSAFGSRSLFLSPLPKIDVETSVGYFCCAFHRCFYCWFLWSNIMPIIDSFESVLEKFPELSVLQRESNPGREDFPRAETGALVR